MWVLLVSGEQADAQSETQNESILKGTSSPVKYGTVLKCFILP